MTLISLFAVMVCHAQQKTNDTEQAVQPSRARELIKQWVQTERLISEEKTSWQVEKQQMQDLHLVEKNRAHAKSSRLRW